MRKISVADLQNLGAVAEPAPYGDKVYWGMELPPVYVVVDPLPLVQYYYYYNSCACGQDEVHYYSQDQSYHSYLYCYYVTSSYTTEVWYYGGEGYTGSSAVGSATVASTAHRAAEYDPGLLVTPNVDMWEEMMFSRGDRAVSDLCRIDEWVDMRMEEASPEHIGPLIELGLWLVGVKFLPESDASDVSPNIAPGGDSGLAAREAAGVAAGASDVSVTVGTAGYGVEADYAAGSIDSNDSGGVVSSIADGGADGGVDAGGSEPCVGA